jgi:hypothetical protein
MEILIANNIPEKGNKMPNYRLAVPLTSTTTLAKQAHDARWENTNNYP